MSDATPRPWIIPSNRPWIALGGDQEEKVLDANLHLGSHRGKANLALAVAAVNVCHNLHCPPAELEPHVRLLVRLLRGFVTAHPCKCGDTLHCIPCQARAALVEWKGLIP